MYKTHCMTIRYIHICGLNSFHRLRDSDPLQTELPKKKMKKP